MEHKTKELLALPSSDLEEYKPPKCATFTLTQAELDECLPKFVPGKRMRLIKNWTSVFRERDQSAHDIIRDLQHYIITTL